ncbi:hypothetical protein SteCoe_19872 [Stentor coeruleus]|uniref:Uncharacterized protein n=1 Tax=Stentor coeruleus TaxID=5963 RepID=A0A1R2BCI9_9CILI|nr:hypothetical protein SteCoe_26570 [Stentor coeruleus]OMJ79998.1 hypothetical protein SteCoe_19872 [Stentor coeruleus]
MSYYKYLERYSPAFLRKYQTEQYSHLGRSSRFADIVHMNSTQTLSIDEDISLNLSVPFNITNFLGFAAVLYWYYYHVDMYSASAIKKRLASYQNYKMWSRLEVIVGKSSIAEGQVVRNILEERWLDEKNMTREQLNELVKRVADGESANDVLASWGLKLEESIDKLVKI